MSLITDTARRHGRIAASITTAHRQLYLGHLIADGVLLSGAAGALILATLHHNAEMWLLDYPPAIQARSGDMSAAAARQRRLVAVPLLAVVLGGPALSTWRLRRRTAGRLTFLSTFLHALGVASLLNLADAPGIDYPLILRLRPAWHGGNGGIRRSRLSAHGVRQGDGRGPCPERCDQLAMQPVSRIRFSPKSGAALQR